MAHALDANCLLRWLVRDVPEQAVAIDTILARERVHVADMAIAETMWVMKSYYHISDETMAKSLAKIVEHDNINCNRALFDQVLNHMNTSPKVSFIDTCLVFYAGLGEAKLLTFDKTLAKKFPRLVKPAA